MTYNPVSFYCQPAGLCGAWAKPSLWPHQKAVWGRLAILDDAALEEAKLTESEAWARLMGEAAKHFQDAATLYKIIQDYWPERLAELNMEEPQTRKVKLLDKLVSHWKDNPRLGRSACPGVTHG